MILNIFAQILGFAGSLCLLLFGMDMLSNGIQKGAGNSLQALLGKISGNRFSAVLTGIAVTAIIQSSGATTVMVVSFVNAEIISLTQAIGIIFGANIGTTVTAWIVSAFGFSFSIEAAAIPLFGFGFVLRYFKKFKIHNFADCFMGFALLFMGLGMLKGAVKLNPSSVAFLTKFSQLGVLGLLLGVFIGAAFTALIHSSSAMTAIVLTMAANGSLDWRLSAAIVLGSNIGSTVDAVMSSFGASTNAKRTAFVHVSFNVTGTVIALCLFTPFLRLIDFIVPGIPTENITTHIAMLHTVFNLCATLIFIPFVDQIAKLAEKFVKASEKEIDSHYKLPAILPFSRVSSDLYVFQIRKEIVKMAGRVMQMMDLISLGLSGKDKDLGKLSDQIAFEENYVDEMNEEISHFLSTCSRLPSANHKDRMNFSRLIHVTHCIEELSDEFCSMVHNVIKYVEKKDFDPTSGKMKKLLSYFDLVHIFYEQACTFIALGISDEDRAVSFEMEEKIDQTKKELQKASRKRIEAGNDVKTELQYMDIVRKIERSGDCVFAIVQGVSPYGEQPDFNLKPEKPIVFKNVTVNLKSRKVLSFGQEVQLTAKEYDLLVMLLMHRGEVVTRKKLMETVWKYEKEIESRTIDVHVRLLRQKLSNDELIETVRGVGYKI